MGFIISRRNQLLPHRAGCSVRVYGWGLGSAVCAMFAHLHDPGAVGEGHDVPLLPEEGRVGALDHLKLAELLHGVDLAGGLVSDLQHHRGGVRGAGGKREW